MGIREIIKIDEEKCDGCGVCVPSCAEGALAVVNGKLRLVSEAHCDGLGACLNHCPRGAISMEIREADAHQPEQPACPFAFPAVEAVVSCPGTSTSGDTCSPAAGALFKQWPVQLALISPAAPFLRGAELLLTADCAPAACLDFHARYAVGRALALACPKLDDFQAHQQRLEAIIRQADLKSLTVLRMEVPCCGGLRRMAENALRAAGVDLPVNEIVINLKDR